MSGVFGGVITDIFSAEKRTYYTYKINTEDDRVFEVTSNTSFNKDDCVKVIYRTLPEDTPESGIDADTKAEASNECLEMLPSSE